MSQSALAVGAARRHAKAKAATTARNMPTRQTSGQGYEGCLWANGPNDLPKCGKEFVRVDASQPDDAHQEATVDFLAGMVWQRRGTPIVVPEFHVTSDLADGDKTKRGQALGYLAVGQRP